VTRAKASQEASITSARKRAELAQEMAANGMTKDQIANGLQLADNFEQLSKDYFTIDTAFRSMIGYQKNAVNANGDLSAAAGVAMVFQFMKVQDPGSTVREGEQATARNTTNIPGWIMNLYNQLLVGQGSLNGDQVRDFVRQAATKFQSEATAHQDRVRDFSARAESVHVPPSFVVRPPSPDTTESAAGAMAAPQSGRRVANPANVVPR
jgi:hypothetical protein